jgi:hypothetical protein
MLLGFGDVVEVLDGRVFPTCPGPVSIVLALYTCDLGRRVYLAPAVDVSSKGINRSYRVVDSANVLTAFRVLTPLMTSRSTSGIGPNCPAGLLT